MSKLATKRAQKQEGYALLRIDALRSLRMALDEAPTVSIADLARRYQHLSADLYRIKLHELQHLPEEERTDYAAKLWLIRYVAESYLTKWLDINCDAISLKAGVTPDDLRYEGKRIEKIGISPSHHLRSPFDPKLTTGTFAENIRALKRDDLTELRESMQHFGWLDYHPAILDEHGVVIVGHRRLAVAKELGIEPKTVTITFGSGDPGDAERVRYALASNLGGRPLNPSDRKHIAQRLYATGEWSLRDLARALNDAKSNIERDVQGVVVCPTRDKPKDSYSPKGGRPKGSKTRSQQREKAEAAIKQIVEAGEEPTVAKVAAVAKVSRTAAEPEVAIHRATASPVTTDPLRDKVRQWLVAALRDAPSPLTPEAVKTLARDLERLVA